MLHTKFQSNTANWDIPQTKWRSLAGKIIEGNGGFGLPCLTKPEGTQHVLPVNHSFAQEYTPTNYWAIIIYSLINSHLGVSLFSDTLTVFQCIPT